MSNFIATSSVIFCDVVTGMDFQDFPVALRLDSSLAQVIIDLEQELLDPSRRSSVEELKRLLHPWFREVGASGRNYDRESIIAQLAMEPIRQSGPLKVANPVALQLAGHLVLLRWHLHAEVSSERSSLWILEQDRWQMIFHQGTTSSAQILLLLQKLKRLRAQEMNFVCVHLNHLMQQRCSRHFLQTRI